MSVHENPAIHSKPVSSIVLDGSRHDGSRQSIVTGRTAVVLGGEFGDHPL